MAGHPLHVPVGVVAVERRHIRLGDGVADPVTKVALPTVWLVQVVQVLHPAAVDRSGVGSLPVLREDRAVRAVVDLAEWERRSIAAEGRVQESLAGLNDAAQVVVVRVAVGDRDRSRRGGQTFGAVAIALALVLAEAQPAFVVGYTYGLILVVFKLRIYSIS